MVNNDMNFFLLILSGMIVNNILLIKLIGLCSFFETKTSIGMSLAVMFVMCISSSISWLVYNYLLLPFGLVYLRTMIFILIIVFFAKFTELFIKFVFRELYILNMPLIFINCAVLAAAFFGIDYKLNFINNLVYSISIAGGYLLAIILFSGIMERINMAPVSRSFKGYPIAFIAAGLMSLAFLGFKGLLGL